MRFWDTVLSEEYCPEEDIYQFLKDSFDKIRREHPFASYIPSSWPSTDILHEITWKSSGQFLFASTTVKYIGGDPYELPTRRLDVIRRLQPPRGQEDLPYAELNSLYNHVLLNVPDIEKVKQVLGILIIVNSEVEDYLIDSTDKLDSLFFWQPSEAKASLSQLSSIIGCDANGGISILHASLSDFLLDPSRSHQLYLCRGSVLGDCAALGLRHLRQQKLHGEVCHSTLSEVNSSCANLQLDQLLYSSLTEDCISASPFCTPLLLEELNQLSFQTLYRVYKMHERTDYFWWFVSKIIEMLHIKVGRNSPHCSESVTDT